MITADNKEVAFSIKYGEIETVPFTPNVEPHKNLGKFIIVSNGKFFSTRFGVIDLQGRFVTDVSMTLDMVDKVKLLGTKGVVLPRNGGWCICDFSGKPYNENIYDNIKYLSDDFAAVGLKDSKTGDVLYAFADIYGVSKTPFQYVNIQPFSEKHAIAQLTEGVADIYGDDGTALFSFQCRYMRNFCNGYAVFERGGRFGAIDTAGSIAVQPQFAWLRDCEYGLFCYSDKTDPTIVDNMGLVDCKGDIIVKTQRGLRDLNILDRNIITHRIYYTSQETSGNKTITYKIPATGFIIGEKITSAKYLFIGQESEGLKAFAAYTQQKNPPFIGKGRFTAGYMDDNFNTVITLTETEVTWDYEFNNVHKCANSEYMSPFINGLAVVKIQWGSSRLSSRDASMIAKKSYVIDKSGHIVTDPAAVTARLAVHNTANNINKFINDESMRMTEALLARGLMLVRLFKRSKCVKVADNIWNVNDEGVEKTVFSSMESITDREWAGYSCGLHCVVKNRKQYGFVDENLNIVVEPIYKRVSHFHDNVAWAQREKQWYILKRSCTIDIVPKRDDIAVAELARSVRPISEAESAPAADAPAAPEQNTVRTYSNPDRSTHIRMAFNDLTAMSASAVMGTRSLESHREWIRNVGWDLYNTHGFSAMQEVFQSVTGRYPEVQSQLSKIWDGVGDWAD